MFLIHSFKKLINLRIVITLLTGLSPLFVHAEPAALCVEAGGIWDECAGRDWSAFCLDQEGVMRTFRDPEVTYCSTDCICPNDLFFDGEDCVNAQTFFIACDEIQRVDPSGANPEEDTRAEDEIQFEDETPTEDEEYNIHSPTRDDERTEPSTWGDGYLNANETNECSRAGGIATVATTCQHTCVDSYRRVITRTNQPCLSQHDYCDCGVGLEYIEGECIRLEPTMYLTCDGDRHTLRWDESCLEQNTEECELLCLDHDDDCFPSDYDQLGEQVQFDPINDNGDQICHHWGDDCHYIDRPETHGPSEFDSRPGHLSLGEQVGCAASSNRTHSPLVLLCLLIILVKTMGLTIRSSSSIEVSEFM